MKLEDYFDFISETDIRIRGTRVGIETILYEYIHRQQTAEAIHQRYPNITLEQIYATLLFYHHNRSRLNAYMDHWLHAIRTARIHQKQHKPPVVQKLQHQKTKRHVHTASE